MYNFDVRIGTLVIFTGASGAGKDSVMDKFLERSVVQKLNLKKIVTCTDRPPRPGELDGIQYHFVSSTRLQEMADGGELVEPITQTGTSNKATPKSEIERLLMGENLVWRIDPSRAAEIALGGFFQKLFPAKAQTLQEHTIILFVTAPKEVIRERRKRRDLDRYNPAEYRAREDQEKPYLEILKEKAISIENPDGKLEKAVDLAVESVIHFNDKIKN